MTILCKTALYRHYDKHNRLLYVGISLSAVQRLAQHKNSSWYKDIVRVEIEHFENRIEASKAEIAAIKKEKPIYNKIYNKQCRAAKAREKVIAKEKQLEKCRFVPWSSRKNKRKRMLPQYMELYTGVPAFWLKLHVADKDGYVTYEATEKALGRMPLFQSIKEFNEYKELLKNGL